MTTLPPEAVRAAQEAVTAWLMGGTDEAGTWLESDELLARAALEAAEPLIRADERWRIRDALLGCRDCGKIHERRDVPVSSANMTGWTLRDPDDGHAYAPPLAGGWAIAEAVLRLIGGE